eukprot:TRINITY_DN10481_c0_g2_i2.p1 TRINITY_DN10481_c0_g2~~TRINITY_DN10481_c0_g2_i2.p1  ORF type:complete len:505 (+),score=148.22 TRINITY_DN10481_c0_g2_i2:1458-2972(+)
MLNLNELPGELLLDILLISTRQEYCDLQLLQSFYEGGSDGHSSRHARVLDLRLVCKQWNELCGSAAGFWSEISVAFVPPLLPPQLDACTKLSTQCDIEDSRFAELLQRCPHLVGLHVYNNAVLRSPRLESTAIQAVTLVNCESLESPVIRCPALRSLHIDFASAHRLDSPVLELPSLEVFRLSEADSIEPDAVRLMMGGFRLLREFHMSYCSRIWDEHLNLMLQRCPELTVLDLFNCPTLHSPPICHPQLKVLSLGHESPFETFEQVVPSLMVGPRIECALLESVAFVQLPQLLPQAVQFMAQHSPLLRHLSIVRCPNINDAALRTTAQSCPLLKSVKLSMTDITDQTVSMFAELCPELETLHLEACPHLVRPSVVSGSLRDVLIAGRTCRAARVITCEVEHVTLRCPQLESLSLLLCDLIADDTIADLRLADCPQLHTLVLDGCSSLRRPRIESASLRNLSMHPVRCVDSGQTFGVKRRGFVLNCPSLTTSAMPRTANAQPRK